MTAQTCLIKPDSWTLTAEQRQTINDEAWITEDQTVMISSSFSRTTSSTFLMKALVFS